MEQETTKTKKQLRMAALGFVAILALAGAIRSQWGSGAPEQGDSAHLESYAGEVPVPGVATMVDLGADECVPCKMMAPILFKMEKEYRGRAAVVFYDVWKNQEPARRFGIRAIPTQIFFDASGQEVARHEGFMDEKAIMAQLEKLGVKPPGAGEF